MWGHPAPDAAEATGGIDMTNQAMALAFNLRGALGNGPV